MLTAYFTVFTLTTLAALMNSKARRLVYVILVSWAVTTFCERLGMIIDRPLQVMAPAIDGLTFWAMLLKTLETPTIENRIAVRMMAFLLGVHAAFTALLALGAQAHFAYMWSINGVYLCVMLTLVGDLRDAWQRATSLLDRARDFLSFSAGVFATPKGRYREETAGLGLGVQEAHCQLHIPSVEAR